MEGLATDDVRALLETARRSGYAEVELRVGGDRFHAILDPRAKRPAPKPAEEAPPVESFVRSTMVGYFRAVAAVGQTLAPGDRVGAVEAVGIENDVLADEAGVLAEWLVEDGAAVEYGQALARTVPA